LKKLPLSYYQQTNVVGLAQDLLGKLLVSRFNNQETIVRICETEAYCAVKDKASHAYQARRTAKNESMYHQGGVAYVYLCYGIHQLFNVVTNKKDVPDAVLIRAGIPVKGLAAMANRCQKNSSDRSITSGPGNLAKAMGFSRIHNRHSLLSNELFLATDSNILSKQQIICSPRVGVAYAGKDALLPFRFYIADCLYVSHLKNPPRYVVHE
jgi:DNA-3-methyladenine glycosylase